MVDHAALLLEQNEECAGQGARYMSLETIAPLSDDLIVNLQSWLLGQAANAARGQRSYTTLWGTYF